MLLPIAVEPPTEKSVALYKELAKGDLGLIVTGFAFVSPLGQAVRGQYGVHTDAMIPGLRRIAGVAHRGGANIAVQLVHAGLNSGYLRWRGMTPLAVSEMESITRPHREMTNEDIEAAIADFASAAQRVVEAGFDAIQLHGAHGYLMSQFLSPLYNRRIDMWGGSAENRRRFHLEVVRRIRKAVGRDFPLMIKFGVSDDREGGLPLTEGLETARELVAAGDRCDRGQRRCRRCCPDDQERRSRSGLFPGESGLGEACCDGTSNPSWRNSQPSDGKRHHRER